MIPVVAFYATVTLALTWPLALDLTRALPGDFGDPLFTSWVLAWDATHLGRGWWSANIFAPQPLALAYSEHFLPQAVMAMPVYLITRNPILAYNLVFLSTFVLSASGMFLLVRELTGNRRAALVAGLAFAFAPYRIASIPHLQVLSSAWMPFVLFGLRRHFDTRRLRPLAGAAAAWIVQNLSCGYYFLFFSPIVALYIIWELWVRGWWRDGRELRRIAVACGAVALATAPFLLPYLELRAHGFSPRSLAETRKFSADVYGYLTADPNLRLWGPVLQAWPRAEGLLFPGLTILVLAAAAIAASIPRAATRRPDWRAIAVRSAAATAIVVSAALLLGYTIRLPGVKITSLPRLLALCAGSGGVLLAISRSTRTAFAGWLRTPAAWLALMTAFAAAMSFGPEIRAMGRTVAGASVYALFYDYVPGFDGLRVPARYAMLVTFGLAALAGIGVAVLERHPAARRARGGNSLLACVAGALIVVEAVAAPMPINQNSTDYSDPLLAALPASIELGRSAPPVYPYIGELPAAAVVLELPLGEPAFDIRYMAYSTLHWRRLVNGYSGGFPAAYLFLTESLRDWLSRPARAWQALADSTATHVVVHQGFYKGDAGAQISAWLRAYGAREIAAFGRDVVFELPIRHRS